MVYLHTKSALRFPEKYANSNIYNLDKDVNEKRAIKGSLGPEYFKDSPHYKKVTFKEIKDYQTKRIKDWWD